MVRFRAVALALHDDHWPGWIEVSIRDAKGEEHRIVEKIPVLTQVEISPDTTFPFEFWMAGETATEVADGILVTLPYSIETSKGATRITISRSDAKWE
jgi:hypothetical protein